MKKNWKLTTMMILISIMLFSLTGCGSVKMKLDNRILDESKDLFENQKDGAVIQKNTGKKLEEIEELIGENFYFEDNDEEKQDGIIHGYMQSLDDPYSVYYNEKEYAQFMDDTGGEYVGVGFQVSQARDTKVITVVKVFDGPAKQAGILANDILVGVNGEDITDQDIDTVVDKIRGEPGTEVTLKVYRGSDDQEYEMTMKRKKLENPTVEYKMLENQIGYIAVSSFYEVTAEQFIYAVEDLEDQGMVGLIVDLRDNGGGLLSIATIMLDYMLPEGKIVYTEDKNGKIIEEYNSTDTEQFTKPLVVMVNGYSASASEIFAGAIKDYGIGTLVGTKTFGKGIVQRIFPLEDGSAIKLTIAKYFTPNGNDIHEVGIEPDVEVELDVEAYKESEGKEDNQLDQAIEEILKKVD